MMLFSYGKLVRASFLCLPLLSSLPFPADAGISTAPDIQVGFSPEGTGRLLVLNTIGSAQQSIRMMAYSFTDPDVMKALIAAHQRSVDVKIVIDEKGNRNRASMAAMNLIVNAGIPLRTNDRFPIQHDKILIVDNHTVESGSYNCRFYSVWSDERQTEIYQGEAVRAAADGTIVVRLPTGLQKKAPSGVKPAENASDDEPVKRKRRPSMSLLGLLHLLWEQSGINVWHPAFDKKKRTPGWVSWHLQQTAARIRIGRVPLEESLLLMAMKGTQQVIANREHLRAAEKNKRRLIVVSMLAGWSEAGEARLQAMLPLGLFSGFPDLVMPEDVRHRMERSFSRELGDWRRGMKVMVIAETEPPETSFRHIDGLNRPSSCSTVIDVALMTVSPRFIPLDSGYESAVEEKLWQEKRAFIKPLRYDGEDDVFPDFVLKDVPGVDALPMEVFGMNSPEYLQRRQVKTSHYEAEYGPGRWWYWDAAAKSDMPAFPCV